jgi:hypothetical protein
MQTIEMQNWNDDNINVMYRQKKYELISYIAFKYKTKERKR